MVITTMQTRSHRTEQTQNLVSQPPTLQPQSAARQHCMQRGSVDHHLRITSQVDVPQRRERHVFFRDSAGDEVVVEVEVLQRGEQRQRGWQLACDYSVKSVISIMLIQHIPTHYSILQQNTNTTNTNNPCPTNNLCTKKLTHLLTFQPITPQVNLPHMARAIQMHTIPLVQRNGRAAPVTLLAPVLAIQALEHAH